MNVLASLFKNPFTAVLAFLFLLGTPLCNSQTEPPKLTFRQLLAKAQSGDSDAQYRLGLLYNKGSQETPKDQARAIEWFRRSAVNGDARGEYALGLSYVSGNGITRDDEVGFGWLYKSALKGYPEAQASLWTAYKGGFGTPKSESEGLNWLLESAKNGYPASQVALCDGYQRNTHLGNDPTMAYAWCLVAQSTVAENKEVVTGFLAKVQAVLTPSQSEEGRMLASSWGANHRSGGTMPLHSRSFLHDAEFWDAVAESVKEPPAPVRSHTRSGGCETGHWVDSVMSDGEIVKLEDGSIWQVDSADSVDSSLWLDTEDVTVCDGKLINTDDHTSVGAHQLR